MTTPSTRPPSGSSCCGPAAASTVPSHADVRDTVRAGYAQIARTGQWSGVAAGVASSPCCEPATAGTPGCCEPQDARAEVVAGSAPSAGGCCGPTSLSADDVATAVGYASADLAALPAGANLGLSCGNPTALAALREGEVVLDLGSGAGFDCFLAGPRVGASGRVIGVDMTPEMVSRARASLPAYRETSGLDNVEFRLGEIENLPVADASVDVVVSNCVLNLSPDKARTWREIARVLRPGGRVAVSDLMLLRPLPDAVRGSVEALVGCVAGAALVDETRRDAAAAGLADVDVRLKPGYVAAFESAQDPLYVALAESLPAGTRIADFVTSADVVAVKR